MGMNNSEVVAEFVVESREHLADIENQLLTIEAQASDLDLELVNTVFRSVHSIKGASGFLGFTTVGELAHGMENVLNLLRNRELTPDKPMIDVLLKAADSLRALINDIENSNGTDIESHLKALHRISEGESDPAEPSHQNNAVVFAGPDGIVMQTSLGAVETQRKLGHHLYIVDFDLVQDADEKGRTPLALIKDLLTYAELIESYMPAAEWGGLEDTLPTRVRYVVLAGSMLEESDLLATALELPIERVIRATTAATPEITAQPQSTPVEYSPPAAEPPQVMPQAVQKSPTPVEEKAPTAASRPSSETIADANIRVSVQLLDHLMNLAGELVLGRNQMLQMIAERSQSGLESVGARLNQVTSELQEAIMQTRMQPIGSVFSKFPRVVRDLSSKLGKQCDLLIEGKEVELDKSLLEIITDPLTHLVRNSIDHGIEKPEVRVSAGKQATGRVVLKAFHQAGKVNISIMDDGRGMDPAVIRKKAVEKGLIQAGREQEMSDRDVLRLVFHPGFSTAEKLTDVSGRGVGMDVVKTNIEKAGGTVEIDSRPGAGSAVHIRLPLTLAIIPSLVVRCCGERYAIPQVSISELLRIKASDISRKIERIHGAEVIRLRGSLLPLVRLEKALGMSRPSTDGQETAQPQAVNVIVVETGHLRYGLIVDGLQDSEEIVVKPLGSHLKGTPCLAGATILGDGKVALILDVPGVASHCRLSVSQESKSEQTAQSTAQGSHEQQTVLLFSNDPHEEFAIPMGLIARIERIRASQIDTVGGQEVLQYRGSSLPLLVLERYVKARPRPEKESVYVVVFRVGRQEVGLIAPTLVDIRDIDTNLDIVTFREPGILGSTVVEGSAVRLIDLVELVRLARPEWLAEETERNTRHTGRKVLLAEDSGFFRKQVEDLLTTEGYDVLACEDGAAAWAALQTADPPVDLVVTDIEMPNMDGYELTRHIKGDAHYKDIPVIAVTSLAGQEDLERGQQAGVNDYQIKLDRDQLVESVGRFLRASGRSQRATASSGRIS